MSRPRQEWIDQILSEPTTSVPNAGKLLGIAGKNQAYQAAARGEIRVLVFGRT
jgi:hypothetical protein